MRKINFVFLVLIFLLSSCVSSGLISQKPQVGTIENPPILTLILPKDSNIIEEPCFLTSSSCEYILYAKPSTSGLGYSRRDLIRIRIKSSNQIIIERRTDNGISGSGKIYICNFSKELENDKYVVKIIPIQWKTYHEGLILPFNIPRFDIEDILPAIAPYIRYKYEVNSPYTPESIYANFERLAKFTWFSAPLKDELTGKIFKRQFYIVHQNKHIKFFLEVYPYRNGSKAIMYIKIPAYKTNTNFIDYSIIIKEVTQKLEKIVLD